MALEQRQVPRRLRPTLSLTDRGCVRRTSRSAYLSTHVNQNSYHAQPFTYALRLVLRGPNLRRGRTQARTANQKTDRGCVRRTSRGVCDKGGTR